MRQDMSLGSTQWPLLTRAPVPLPTHDSVQIARPRDGVGHDPAEWLNVFTDVGSQRRIQAERGQSEYLATVASDSSVWICVHLWPKPPALFASLTPFEGIRIDSRYAL